MEAQLCKCAFFNRLFEIPLEQSLMASKYQNWCDIGEKMEKRTSCVWTSTLMMEIFQPYPQQECTNLLYFVSAFVSTDTFIINLIFCLYIKSLIWKPSMFTYEPNCRGTEYLKAENNTHSCPSESGLDESLWHVGFLKFTTMNWVIKMWNVPWIGKFTYQLWNGHYHHKKGWLGSYVDFCQFPLPMGDLSRPLWSYSWRSPITQEFEKHLGLQWKSSSLVMPVKICRDASQCVSKGTWISWLFCMKELP